MGIYDDILKSMQQRNALIKQMSIPSSLIQIAKTQAEWKQNISGFSMLNDIARSLNTKTKYFDSYISGIDAIAKSVALQPKFNIPLTAFDTINSINRQHQQFFAGFRSITDLIRQSQVTTQVNAMQIALSGYSGQLAAIAAAQQKWNLLEDFEKITSEALLINEKIIADEGITNESLTDIKNFLGRIEIKIDKNDAETIFWKIITLLSLFFALMGEIRNWIPKPEYATKVEVERMLKQQFSIFESKLKTQNEYRTTNRICKVLLKPKFKTLVITELPIGFDVIVLQVQHKWVYVSFINPIDNLPKNGWILKKYLDRPKWNNINK